MNRWHAACSTIRRESPRFIGRSPDGGELMRRTLLFLFCTSVLAVPLLLKPQSPNSRPQLTPSALAQSAPANDVLLAAGSDAGGPPQVTVWFREGEPFSFLAWPEAFRGGVRVALGDVNGDGIADLIVGAGPGGSPEVKVFSGRSLIARRPKLLADFFAWPQDFAGGVEVAAGDTNGDGASDVIVGAGPGGSPEVKVYDGATLARGEQPQLLADFFAWPQDFAGGVHVAAGDVNGDGLIDVIVGAGPGGGPEIKVFDGLTIARKAGPALIANFLAWPADFRGGVYVAAGDFNGDGYAHVIAGAGPGGGPEVKVFSYDSMKPDVNPRPLMSLLAYEAGFRGGVRVAVQATESNGQVSYLYTAPGPGRAPHVNRYAVSDLRRGAFQATPFLAGPENARNGVFVAGREAVNLGEGAP
jgi:hypothetical protein